MGSALTTSEPTEPQVVPDYTMTTLTGVTAIIIAVAIVGLLIVLALRKR